MPYRGLTGRFCEVRTHLSFLNRAIECYLLRYSDSNADGPEPGPRMYAAKIEFEPLPENTEVPPSFTLRHEEAQALMDELWHCGIRPSEGTGSAGSLKATQDHLNDMRTLLFHEKGVPR